MVLYWIVLEQLKVLYNLINFHLIKKLRINLFNNPLIQLMLLVLEHLLAFAIQHQPLFRMKEQDGCTTASVYLPVVAEQRLEGRYIKPVCKCLLDASTVVLASGDIYQYLTKCKLWTYHIYHCSLFCTLLLFKWL